MTTLSTVLQKAYRKLGQLNDTVATGGSATTIVDTKQINKFKAPALKQGVAFVVKTSDGLAPQGEFQIISSYANATQTMTTGTFTAAVESGDYVGFAGPDFPIFNMIAAVNEALDTIGDVPFPDTSSLTIVASQSEYDWPSSLKDVAPYRVSVQRITNQTSNNNWEDIEGWEFIPPSTASGQGKLIIPAPYWVGHAIRIIPHGKHPDVRIYSDTISDVIPVELLALGTAIKALEWYNSANSGGDKFAIQHYNDLRAEYDRTMVTQPPAKPKKKAKTLPVVHDVLPYPGDQSVYNNFF